MSRRLLGMVLCVSLMVTGLGGCAKKSKATSTGAAGPDSGKATPTQPGDKAHWPAPASAQVVGLAQAVGIEVGHSETLQHHVHSHLDVFIDGRHTAVPAALGIAIDEPGVHVFQSPIGPAYGGISKPCANPCISPLHTHGASGVIHTESATNVDHTLGQLFGEWGVKLTETCVGEYCLPGTPIAVYVNGTLTKLSEAAAIKLTAFKEIAIVIGSPPPVVPSKGDFTSD